MYRILDIAVSDWRTRNGSDASAQGRTRIAPPDAARPFNLLRWFSVLGFVAVSIFSATLATIVSHFTTREIVDQDATLTRQFIVSVAEAQSRQARLGPNVSLGQILDERADFARLGIDPRVAESVRKQFYDHLRFLPDVLLAHVVARDRKIIWSTNPSMIGRLNQGNADLESAFASSQVRGNISYVGNAQQRAEEQFTRHPEKFFVENHVPLYDPRGDVVAVAEIYKEPASLLRALQLGDILVWICTALGAVFLYLALFWIVRRADKMLNDQQQRLVEAEALCVIGEMSAAVAHGIRNPLASIRTSAELALDGDLDSTRKNATDIISQIDRLGKWVRDLLVFSRPLAGENQQIDVVSLAEECLLGFTSQMERGGVSWTFMRPPVRVPPVVADRALATQALANIVSNALEAMPDGGSLALEFELAALPEHVKLVVTDTGSGMSPGELNLIFKPYYTTKRDGVGLGMALVKRIMERFGGAISLHSRKGEGTRVILSFRSA